MTARELGGRAKEMVNGEITKIFAGASIGAAALWILMIAVTETAPQQLNALAEKHDRAVERQAITYDKSIDKITAEMKEDRAAFRQEFAEMRDTISDKLDEGNAQQRLLFNRLMGLGVQGAQVSSERESEKQQPQPVGTQQ